MADYPFLTLNNGINVHRQDPWQITGPNPETMTATTFHIKLED